MRHSGASVTSSFVSGFAWNQWGARLGWPRSTVEKGPQSNESYERENPWNRTISTVLWVHKKLPQSTVKLVLPSNESYESKTGCNRTLATVLWVPQIVAGSASLTRLRPWEDPQQIHSWVRRSGWSDASALSFFSLVFSKTPRKTSKIPRIFLGNSQKGSAQWGRADFVWFAKTPNRTTSARNWTKSALCLPGSAKIGENRTKSDIFGQNPHSAVPFCFLTARTLKNPVNKQKPLILRKKKPRKQKHQGKEGQGVWDGSELPYTLISAVAGVQWSFNPPRPSPPLPCLVVAFSLMCMP